MNESKQISYSQTTNENQLKYSRDSLDRFGDDLCEEIIQYLWFEDRIRLESVSKQWKRLIFSRQNVLEIGLSKTFNGYLAKRLLEFCDEKCIKLKDISVIECVLKKCPNIRCVKIDRKVDQITDQFWHIIADNCYNLTSIKFDIHMSSEAIKYFGEKHGKTLTSIDNYGHDYSLLLDYCPNLMSIHCLSLIQLMGANITFPKLREIKDFNFDDRSVDLMPSFVSSYANTIKVFKAKYFLPTNSDYMAFMGLISKLPNIEILQLNIFIHDLEVIDSSRFAESFNKIGINCVRVKRMKLFIYCNVTMNTMLSAIKSFTKLNYLHLSLDLENFHENVDQNISIKMLSQCTDLKTISIYCLSSISDAFFANVEQYLPQLLVVKILDNKLNLDETIKNLAKLKNLQTLTIDTIDTIDRLVNIKMLRKCSDLKMITISHKFFANIEEYLPQFLIVNIMTDKCISDEAINILKHLQNLYIESESYSGITDTAICNLIENCPQIHSFSFNPCPPLTAKTINTFNQIAKNRPNSWFTFIFKSRRFEYYNTQTEN